MFFLFDFRIVLKQQNSTFDCFSFCFLFPTPLTCRKCASTMFMYMSSSSLPLPMKHRCSPLAMDPDSKDCFWASRRDFTERANSEGFWSICGMKRTNEIQMVHKDLQKYFTLVLCPTRSESRWKAVDRCPALYCSAGRQSTTKKRTPSCNVKIHLQQTLIKMWLFQQSCFPGWKQLNVSHWPAAADWPGGFQGRTRGGREPDSDLCPPL